MNQKTDDNNDSAARPAPEATFTEESADIDADEATADGPTGGTDPRETEELNVPPAQPPRRGFSPAVAWVALLLALLALASTGYLAWLNRAGARAEAGNEAAIAAVSSELDEAVDSLQARQQAALAGLEDAARQRAAKVDSLERQLGELGRQNESIAPRLSSLESSLSSLQGVSAGVRETWLLAEAEYYMQIANAQLQLANNPRIAALALEFADERVRQTANPALGEVRRALTQELQELRSMETADIEGMTLALASLAERTASLPLEQNVDAANEEPSPVNPELTGFSRAVASMKRALGDIVSIRRTDQPLTPLLSPDAAYFLRANLSLQFQAARLALLKGEQAIFERSLADAAEWLREYYDADSGAVSGVLDTLAELQESGVRVTAPDISQSLRLLRQYRSLQGRQSPGGDVNESGNGGIEESTP